MHTASRNASDPGPEILQETGRQRDGRSVRRGGGITEVDNRERDVALIADEPIAAQLTRAERRAADLAVDVTADIRGAIGRNLRSCLHQAAQLAQNLST